jgi:hypothetical protein
MSIARIAGNVVMSIARIAGNVVLLALLAGTVGCRNEVQPPTFPAPLPASEVTKKAPKPQPIDPKRDTKHKAPTRRVSDALKSTN